MNKMHNIKNICDASSFLIPANQRGYSWSTSEIDDVFDDLELASPQSHYMGPLILTESDAENVIDDELNKIHEYILEDGQQRLTTLFLIANGIMKALIKLNGEENKDVYELDKVIFYYTQGKRNLRIVNQNSLLNAFLLHIVTGSPLPSGDSPPMKRMKENTIYIDNKLESNNIDELNIIKHRILNAAKFIWVDLTKEDVNRYLTFDAINSRGLPLSEFDKIKNFCILVNQVRKIGLYPEKNWYEAISNLQKYNVSTRSSEAAFIAELYSSFHSEQVGQNSVHKDFVAKYRELLKSSNHALERDFRDFVELWSDYSNAFGFVTSKARREMYGKECTSEAGKWLDRLDNLDLTTVTRILLTSAFQRMNQKDFEEVVRVSEVYTFRVNGVAGRRKDFNNKKIITLSNEILRLNKDVKYIINKICGLLAESSPVNMFVKFFIDGEAKYNHDSKIKGWDQCYYFLYEYEISKSPAGVSPLPWASDKSKKINTQEHILPQTHRDEGWWEKQWPDEMEAENFKHRLGNLVLTPGNSSLGRKSIDKKICDKKAKHYFTHKSASNTEKLISDFTDGVKWKKENILSREIDMIRFAIDRWSVPCCVDNATIRLPEDFVVNGDVVDIEVRHDECYVEPREDELIEHDGFDITELELI